MLIIRRRNNYTRGRGQPKNFFEKISQCRKLSHSAEKGPIPYLNTCIAYLNTLSRLSALADSSRLSAPYLNTLPTRQHSRQNRVLRHQSRQPIRIEYYVTRVVITSPESSRLGVKTLLGSRLESARYSLS